MPGNFNLNSILIESSAQSVVFTCSRPDSLCAGRPACRNDSLCVCLPLRGVTEKRWRFRLGRKLYKHPLMLSWKTFDTTSPPPSSMSSQTHPPLAYRNKPRSKGCLLQTPAHNFPPSSTHPQARLLLCQAHQTLSEIYCRMF